MPQYFLYVSIDNFFAIQPFKLWERLELLMKALKNNLSLDDKPSSDNPRSAMAPPNSTRPLRPENIPPSANAKNGLVGHRPSRSSEEEKRRQLNGGKSTAPQGLDIFADPPEAKPRRLKRNSDSSLVDKSGKLQDPEVERRRKERRHREREARHKDGKGRVHGSSSKSKKPSQRLDVIDSLDVTSIYGTGCKNLVDVSASAIHTDITDSVPPRWPF